MPRIYNQDDAQRVDGFTIGFAGWVTQNFRIHRCSRALFSPSPAVLLRHISADATRTDIVNPGFRAPTAQDSGLNFLRQKLSASSWLRWTPHT